MKRAVALVLVAVACTPSVEEERALGEEYARQVEAQMTISEDQQLDQYIDQLAAQLTRSADSTGHTWRFTIVEADEMNAFAIPGGHIYVNRGLVERVGTMPELAGVLAHEVGHVVLRHSAEQMAKRSKANVAVNLFCSLTGWCEGTAAQVAINVGGAAFFARHSRQDEAEADSVAVQYLVAAGIDPSGVPSLFQRMAAERKASPDLFGAFFSSHPLDEERVERTSALVSAIPESTRTGLRREDEGFMAIKERLAVSGNSDGAAPADSSDGR